MEYEKGKGFFVKNYEEQKEKNQLLADFMGFNYKADGLYHHIQIFNPDGTPYRTSGTLNKNVDCYNLWNPHNDWNNLMPIVEKIEEMGYSVSISNQNTDIWSVHSDSHVTRVRGAFGKLYSKNVAPEGIKLDHKEMSKLETAYTAVVYFITWYKSLSK
jgi:hypothetical protein